MVEVEDLGLILEGEGRGGFMGFSAHMGYTLRASFETLERTSFDDQQREKTSRKSDKQHVIWRCGVEHVNLKRVDGIFYST